MISLGCPKNQMDAELMLARLRAAGFALTNDYETADVVVVNTCGFIEEARREGIEQILELGELKEQGQIQHIVVTGCMAERYREEIRKELPECDAVLGLGANGDIAAAVRAVLDGQTTESFPDKSCWSLDGDRVLTTPLYTAYLRIADGCDNRCTYCAIPAIRGPFRARAADTLLKEARGLPAKELVLVAQDVTRYPNLPALLDGLCEIDTLRWLRLLYCYPDRITDELLDTMARQDKIVKYLDIPLQHVSARVLCAMNRHGDADSLCALMEKIRARVPGVTLRTTVMVGFPGETQEDFEELCAFIEDVRFERLGCFAFSAEEGTAAYTIDGQIDEEEKARRRDIVIQTQARIHGEWCERQVGKTLPVLVEGYDAYIKRWFGRSPADAPDIDGKVFFTGHAAEGDIVDVHITGALEFDLEGEITP